MTASTPPPTERARWKSLMRIIGRGGGKRRAGEREMEFICIDIKEGRFTTLELSFAIVSPIRTGLLAVDYDIKTREGL